MASAVYDVSRHGVERVMVVLLNVVEGHIQGHVECSVPNVDGSIEEEEEEELLVMVVVVG